MPDIHKRRISNSVEEDHPKPRPGEPTTQKMTKTQIKIRKQKLYGYRK
jgi:hypothetical protein